MRLGPRHSPLKAWLAVAGDRGPGPRPLAVDSADWPGSGLAPTCRNTDTQLDQEGLTDPQPLQLVTPSSMQPAVVHVVPRTPMFGQHGFSASFFFGGAERAEALIGAPVSAPSSGVESLDRRTHDEQCWAWAGSIHGSTGRSVRGSARSRPKTGGSSQVVSSAGPGSTLWTRQG